MEKSDINDSASDADDYPDRKGRQGKNILESKSFRDGGIYLFLRGDYKKPIWFCRIKTPGMKGYVYRSTRTANEHLAYKFADDLYHHQLVQVLGGHVVQGTKITVGIDAFVERFEAEKEKLSVHYRVLLLKRVRPLIGSQMFENLNTATISKLTDDLRKNTKKGIMSPNTTKRIYNDLQHFFRWCVEAGYLRDIPKFPRINGEKSRRPHFNEREWRKITRNLREFVKVTNRKTFRERTMLVNYVLILANTGIRVGEARNLKWRDVREVDGGTGKPKNVVLTVNGKTGIREVVSRTADIKLYFWRIYDLRLAETEGTSLDPDGLVFCHKDGSEIGSFKKSFQTLLEKCGVETDSFGRKRTIYSLRHTYATFRLHEGVNHYILSRNMGTSVKMLEDYYGHTSNVTMSEELTKGRTHTPTERTRRQKPQLNDAAFGWLTGADNASKPSQIHPYRPEGSKIPASEPSYVDLMVE